MVRFNASGTNPDHKGGAGGIDKGGLYHFVVEKFEDFSQADNPCLKFQCVVAAGEHDDQIGRKHTETFWLGGKDEKSVKSAQNRVMEFACSIGIYSKRQWRADIEANQDAELPFEQSEGRQFVAPIEMRPYSGKDENKKKEYEGRKFANLGFKFHAVGDEEADKCPKDRDYLALFGPPGSPLPTKEGTGRVPGTGGNGNGGTPPAGNGAKTPPKSPPSAPPASSGFGGNF